MLEPQDRRMLLEALRPPPGYTLNHALGTSFSLDLMALVAAPLAFTAYAWEDEDGAPTTDRQALLAALRDHAERITLFCQAGQISVPPAHQLLFAELEHSVVEVTAPHPNGVFHPKIWLLRYEAHDKPPVYRLLCLSRNLTFDRSWDVALVLDGVLADRRNAYAQNHPIGDFFSALPRLARAPLRQSSLAAVDLMQDEVRRVHFEPPDGFTGMAYWPLGLRRSPSWPFEGRTDRLLTISPFLAKGTLGRLVAGGHGNVLVSRLEELQRLTADELAGFEQIKVLSEGTREDGVAPVGTTLSGLHAKAYVADAGCDARMWVGSANATDAAYRCNVEFLVELEGRKRHCGVDACLGMSEIGSVGFGDLLEDYEPSDERADVDDLREELERQAARGRAALACGALTARVVPAEDRFAIEVRGEGPLGLAPGAIARVWPVTLGEAVASRALVDAPPVFASLAPMGLEAITPFFAFEVTATSGGKSASVRFVHKLELDGEPPGRREAILRSLLASRSGVLRYLLMLLAGGGDGLALALTDRVASLMGGKDDDGTSIATVDLPLLEPLLQAVDHDPARLRQIARLVGELRGTQEGRALLPVAFDGIWDAIWAACPEEVR